MPKMWDILNDDSKKKLAQAKNRQFGKVISEQIKKQADTIPDPFNFSVTSRKGNKSIDKYRTRVLLL